MNIVVLDGYTLNPGDLDWQPLANLAKQGREGQFRCYGRTAETELISRASDADIIFTNKTPITAEILSQLPNLKYIDVLATGTNVVGLTCANERGKVDRR